MVIFVIRIQATNPVLYKGTSCAALNEYSLIQLLCTDDPTNKDFFLPEGGHIINNKLPRCLTDVEKSVTNKLS